MKRITLALCAAIIFLGAMAQGLLQKRLQGNPKIDSLVNEVKLYGGKPSFRYYYDGKLHKQVYISCFLMNDFQPTPATGDPKEDAIIHAKDSIRQRYKDQFNRLYKTIRNTCKALTDDAKESYTWEYHRNGMDSVRYTLALGEYQGGDTLRIWQRERDVRYHGAPEIITFSYKPFPPKNGSQSMYKGVSHFLYEHTPDSVGRQRKDLVPFNQENYTTLLQPILTQKGITRRQFYVYRDSTYLFDEDTSSEDFVIRYNTLSPRQLKSETRGTVYTMHSKEQADSVLSQVVQATWSFLEDNPGVDFTFEPYTYFGPMSLNCLFSNKDYHRIKGFYDIYLHHIDDKEYNIVIVEGKGDMIVPMEWLIMKSWKNGKVVYDKIRKKNMTPKQARDNTSNSNFIATGQYEPVD
jgi:hypothetical protein